MNFISQIFLKTQSMYDQGENTRKLGLLAIGVSLFGMTATLIMITDGNPSLVNYISFFICLILFWIALYKVLDRYIKDRASEKRRVKSLGIEKRENTTIQPPGD